SLLRAARAEGVDVRLRFVPSGVPDAALLREARCDLLVTPFPPEGPDIFQVRLFRDRLACFFDASQRKPPATLKAFRACPFVEVRFPENKTSLISLSSLSDSELPEPRVSVSNFAAVPAFIRGTDMIATELRLMALGPLKGLDVAPLPFKTAALPMYLAWHRRDHTDPAHAWLRDRIRAAGRAAVDEAVEKIP
ncbi:MAG: LysR substrate-binding domain-containing protein, partial [Pseudomonadota bacterium]